MWEIMLWPALACILLPGLLVYLGLHVVRRGIIFIDIAMAQMASLGICVAVMLHSTVLPDLNLDGPWTFALALGFTLLGAAVFALTGRRSGEPGEVPQEAIIGIAYVVSAAAAVLVLSRAAEGDEEIKNMLVGNVLLVTPAEVWRTLGLFAGVGAFHWFARKSFLRISFAPQEIRAGGSNARWWDFLFYATFGVVVTSFVRIVGVLLVFTYLIVPAVCAILTARRFVARLALGTAISLIGGLTGLWVSFFADLPSGAAIVCVFGVLLVIAGGVGAWRRKRGRWIEPGAQPDRGGGNDP
jgi:zinc/manganese transport system permease protein